MSPENSTPEWFQMAQADAFESKPKSRVVRIIALAIPLLVLGAGLVFTQTQDSPSAVASSGTNTVSTAVTSTPISFSSTPTTQKTPIIIRKPGITIPTGDGPTGDGEDDGLRSSDDD